MEWMKVRIVSIGEFHIAVTPRLGANVTVTVSVSMGLLKVTTTGAVQATPVAPSDGLVATTWGLGHDDVMKLQGLGAGPGSTPPIATA